MTKLEKYGPETSYALFKAIACRGLFNKDTDFSTFENKSGFDNEIIRDMLEQIYIGIRPNIDQSVKNRKANHAREQKKREEEIQKYADEHPDKPYRRIADDLGTSKSTVGRALHKKKIQPVDVLEYEENEQGDEQEHNSALEIESVCHQTYDYSKPWWFGLPQRPTTPLKWISGDWYEDSDGWKIELGAQHPARDEIIGPPYPDWWSNDPDNPDNVDGEPLPF